MKGAAKNGPSCLQNIQAMEKQVRGGSQPASRGAPPPRARPLSLRGEKETPNAVLSLSRDSRALAHALSPPPPLPADGGAAERAPAPPTAPPPVEGSEADATARARSYLRTELARFATWYLPYFDRDRTIAAAYDRLARALELPPLAETVPPRADQ